MTEKLPAKRSRLPSAAELMQAVADTMERKLLPALKDGKLDSQRFNLRVTLNVIRIIQREMSMPEDTDTESQLFSLAEQIRNGGLDESDPDLLRLLRQHCLNRLAVDNPKYSACLAAIEDK